MKKNIITIMTIAMVMSLSACGSSATTSDATGQIATTENVTEFETETETTETETETTETEKFIAQGTISFWVFLDNASDNGYSIDNPHRDENWVTAVAYGSTGDYNIKYFVENEYVFNVTIYLSTLDDLLDEGYLNCISAMGKALNPSMDDVAFSESMISIHDNPDKPIVATDMQFLYDSEDTALSISY